MPAVVRVKRRIDEEPLGAFVLNGKKRRVEGGSRAATSGDEAVAGVSTQFEATAGKDELSTILKFAGTMQSQDDNATSQLARLTKDEARQLVQQKSTSRKPTNVTERARQEMRQSLHENRFRVVNCLRTTLDTVGEETEEGTAVAGGATTPKEITIVDIEKHTEATPASSSSNVGASSALTAESASVVELSQPSDSDTGYVYDLYLPENEQQAEYVDLMDDNYLSVRAFDDLVYEDRFNNEDDDDDSEDSNQENHFGNDYPDEDDDYECNLAVNDDDDNEESEGTRQMRHAVEKFVFEDEDEDEEAEYFDQSSEDDDCVEYTDPYVHMVDTNEEGFAENVHYSDVDRYGMAYARYKARILKRLKGSNSSDDDDKDSDAEEKSEDERYHSASENEKDCYE